MDKSIAVAAWCRTDKTANAIFARLPRRIAADPQRQAAAVNALVRTTLGGATVLPGGRVSLAVTQDACYGVLGRTLYRIPLRRAGV